MQEIEALFESLDKTCTRYKMEISAEKTKSMKGIQRGIKDPLLKFPTTPAQGIKLRSLLHEKTKLMTGIMREIKEP